MASPVSAALDSLPWGFDGEDGKWRFVLDSLRGGLDYPGIVKWLAMHPDLDSAVLAAARVREGQVAG